MDSTVLSKLIGAIDRCTVAAKALVLSTAQNLEDTQTITGTTMVLANSPTFIYGVYLNGQRLTKTVDYTITTNTVTFLVALVADSVTVVYKY